MSQIQTIIILLGVAGAMAFLGGIFIGRFSMRPKADEDPERFLTVVNHVPDPPQPPTIKIRRIMGFTMVNNRTDHETPIVSEDDFGVAWEWSGDLTDRRKCAVSIKKHYSDDRAKYRIIGVFLNHSWKNVQWQEIEIPNPQYIPEIDNPSTTTSPVE